MNADKTPGCDAVWAKVVDKAEDLIKDAIRHEPILPFHIGSIYRPYAPVRLKEILGLSGAADEVVKRALGEAGGRAKRSSPGLEVTPHTIGDSRVCGIHLSLRSGEWTEALEYVHGKSADEAQKVLSPPAAELLERIESGELAERFFSEASVRSRIRLFSYEPSFEDVFREIRLKRGVEVTVDEKGEKWKRREHFLKFSAKPASAVTPPEVALNPIFDLPKDDLTNRRVFKRWFHRLLIEAPFTGPDPRFIWRISTRAEFFRCFPALATSGVVDSGPIAGLVATLRENGFFEIGWDWDHNSWEWTVSVRPKATWEEMRTRLAEEEARPTSEAKFGLTSEAAALFDWVRSLDLTALKFGLSPEIEKSLREDRLSLGENWGENLRAVLDLLCEEINDRTPYVLRVVEWKEQYSMGLRIWIRLKDPRNG